MVTINRDFQIFVKPVGSKCNLDCRYCYYLEKENRYQDSNSYIMPDILLEEYIVQHIEACTEQEIRFSWHGGEPTLFGLDKFRTITAIQQKNRPPGKQILNGIQTNGVLLDDEWCRFFARSYKQVWRIRIFCPWIHSPQRFVLITLLQ